MVKLHDDPSVPVDVQGHALPWDPSPAPGVCRKRIERDGGEVARLTSIVRYDAGSSFPAHTHGGGEEYLVLEGTFSDETADHPVGTYVRNGVGTSHAPFTEGGCVILVKLWWMDPSETGVTKVRPARAASVGERLLFAGSEQVHLITLAPGSTSTLSYRAGVEVFVVQGDLQLPGVEHTRWGWSRRPGAGGLPLQTVGGCTLYVKRQHLR